MHAERLPDPVSHVDLISNDSYLILVVDLPYFLNFGVLKDLEHYSEYYLLV